MSTSELIPIYITEVKPGLHERAEGITRKPIYRISWPKRTIRLFGRWTIPATKRGSAKCIRIPEQKLKVPPDVEKQWHLAMKDAEVQEVAVFLSTHPSDSRVCIILAARVENHWFQLYRGSSSWRKLGLHASILRDQ